MLRYQYSTSVKENVAIRNSFNQLTRETFGFDFVDWFEAGHWGADYVPHVILVENQVISNVSVNIMQFDLLGEKKNYIQLGTVMTDRKYQGQGWNRKIIEQVLQEYKNTVDGIYLFGNDSVLHYYPKFGFQPSKEYEYYLPCKEKKIEDSYIVKKVDFTQEKQKEQLYNRIRKDAQSNCKNENDGMYMNKNIGLYQFWIAEYKDSLYYLPEREVYVIANKKKNCLYIEQVFGKRAIEVERLAGAFKGTIEEIILEYTPARKEQFLIRESKKEDCTLFILGKDLERIERDKMIFPILSHA